MAKDIIRRSVATLISRQRTFPGQYGGRRLASDPRHVGWGGRIRTFEYGLQRPAPYRLATPQHRAAFGDSDSSRHIPTKSPDPKLPEFGERCLCPSSGEAGNPLAYTTFTATGKHRPQTTREFGAAHGACRDDLPAGTRQIARGSPRGLVTLEETKHGRPRS